jgi:hypothetical protein
MKLVRIAVKNSHRGMGVLRRLLKIPQAVCPIVSIAATTARILSVLAIQLSLDQMPSSELYEVVK